MDNIMDLNFDKEKTWELAEPTSDNVGRAKTRKVTQVKFYNEYYPSGHRIFDDNNYKDVTVIDKNGAIIDIYRVNRISIPIQSMAIDIILAHLLGNKTHIVDSTLKENEALPLYKEYWQTVNIDTARYELIKSCLALGDGAVLFYYDNGELRWQVLSFFNKDHFHMEYDKYGKPFRFYRYYNDKCDVYDDENCTTYTFDEKWKQERRVPHGFKGMPIAYHYRMDGAFWTPTQNNIDNLELMVSRLSEDNRKKFKSIYHLKTHDAKNVQTKTMGLTDMVVTDTDGGFSLVQPAPMSEQFRFEYETQLEIIFNSLGIVFPKHKSSGDMPTGSMKMIFYPTERVVMSLIHEFDSVIDDINEIIKQGFVSKFPKHIDNITNGNIRASIRMFTPQDDESKVRSITELKRYGVLSSETASEEAPYSSNNEETRKEKERNAEIEYQRKLENLRNINPLFPEV